MKISCNKNYKLLEQVADVVAGRTAQRRSTLAIFDLDGTLFDNRTRTMFILREISEKFDTRVPGLAAAFSSFRSLSVVDYSLDVTLKRLRVRKPAETAFIKQEWAKRFFSDDYQKYDMPLPGAKAYVEKEIGRASCREIGEVSEVA